MDMNVLLSHARALLAASLLWLVAPQAILGQNSAKASEPAEPFKGAPDPDERFRCSVIAAYEFALPVDVMLAVAEQEGGAIGQWKKNRNGTYDIGVMQFNTEYLKELSRFGVSAADVSGPGCYPYRLAAWRIRRHISLDDGDVWERIANYHSRTPALNMKYRVAIMSRSAKWAQRLIGMGIF